MAETKEQISHSWAPILAQRLAETKPLLQILIGPRQVGKTTSLLQLQASWGAEASVISSADDRQLLGTTWIEQEWARARRLCETHSSPLLILDEIQKIANWSETVKRLWDEDVRRGVRVKVVLTGSSSLSLQQGLSESLAGRFEVIPATHGTWNDFVRLTGRGIDDYIFFGGYPGALRFIDDEKRWRDYVNQSIIDSVIAKDILLLTRVDKPALLRRLFQLGCEFSAQVLSYQKALGQLQDAGNTTTLAHYLNLLGDAFVLSGLQKFDGKKHHLRNSSPKFQVHNTALMGAAGGHTYAEAKANPEIWGRYVESCVGAHLLNYARIDGYQVYYWRERHDEVDFVLRRGAHVLALEVKSLRRGKLTGLKKFAATFPKAKTAVVDSDSLPEFLSRSPAVLF